MIELVVVIKVSDYAWKVWRDSWKLLDVKGKRQLVKYLEVNMIEGSIAALQDSETHPGHYEHVEGVPKIVKRARPWTKMYKEE